MPKYTPNLNIQLADPAADGNSTFNVETMINDPIEVLDEALGLVSVSADVRVATTGNITLNALQTVDGIALTAGNRVLVKNQTTGSQNGIYTVAAGAWSRSADADSSAKLAAGLSVYVEEGTVNGKTRWQMDNVGMVSLDTTALTFGNAGGPGSVTDAFIGNRTADPSTSTAYGLSGSITQLFSWILKYFKAITGKTGAFDTPRTTLENAVKRDGDTMTGALHFSDANREISAIGTGSIGIHSETQYMFATSKSGAHVTANAKWDGENWKRINEASGAATLSVAPWGLEARLAPAGTGNIAWRLMGVPTVTGANLTYYVRPDGNDGNDGLTDTAGGAFATIGKAISMISHVVNHAVIINITGTHSEQLALSGFTGRGSITINGPATIYQVYAHQNTCFVAINNITATATDATAIVISRSSSTNVTNCTVTATSTTQIGIHAHQSIVRITSCVVSNRYVGIRANEESHVFSISQSGTGNTYGIWASEGAYVGTLGSQLTGTTPLHVTSGGTITDSGVINPWGDNNRNGRTGVLAYRANSLSLSSGVNTKVVFETEYYDFLNEYDVATGRFTAQKTGMYLVSFSLRVNKSAKDYLVGNIFRNGASYLTPYQSYSNEGINHVSGAIIADLGAGDYLEIYVTAYGGTNTLEPSYNASYVEFRSI